MSADALEARVGQMLPDVTLPALSGGKPIPLRSDRGETNIVVRRHPFNCERCDLYMQTPEALKRSFVSGMVASSSLRHPPQARPDLGSP
jgi:hypothetical protein